MAVEMEMPKDIRKYETKLVGPFTLRQTVCALIGAAYAVPIGLLLPIDNISTKIVIIIFLMAPAIMCGWMKMDGVTPEVFAIRLVYTIFLTPHMRKVKYTNFFYEQYKKYLKKEETRKVAKMSPQRQRAYRNHVINYRTNEKKYHIFR